MSRCRNYKIKFANIFLKLIFISLFLCVPMIQADANEIDSQNIVEGYLHKVISIPEQDGISLRISINSYSGQTIECRLSNEAYLFIDQIPVSINAFQPGMEVYGELYNGNLSFLEGYSTLVPGYVTQGKVRSGTVIKIHKNELQIKNKAGLVEEYSFSPITIVRKNGQVITKGNFYIGDRVKLYLGTVNSNLIMRMEVEGKSALIHSICRGQLRAIDKIQNKVILQDVEVLREGKWQSIQESMIMTIDSKTPLYAGAEKISYQQLPYYQGKRMYWVSSSQLGKETISRMLITSGYENIYTDRIDKMGIAHESLQLNNLKNINLNESTIIIKDYRLQERDRLDSGMDVLVLADNINNNLEASLIYILNSSINASNIGQHSIFAGRLEEVTFERIELEHFFRFEDNEWQVYDADKKLYYDDDTVIYNYSEKKFLDKHDFLVNKYQNKYAYIYTDGERIISIWIKNDFDLPTRALDGIIDNLSSINSTTNSYRAILLEEKNWIGEAWRIVPAGNINFLQDAMIVKNGQIIKFEELQAGDNIYSLNWGRTSCIIIVK